MNGLITIKTWADADGRWHAEVISNDLDKSTARVFAREAIRNEVKLRQGDQNPAITIMQVSAVPPRFEFRER
jgi:hypothetical protein